MERVVSHRVSLSLIKLSVVLPDGATVVLTSTVSPTDASKLEAALVAIGRDLHLIDSPMSGGPSRAEKGDLTLMASGDGSALSKAHSVLKALSAKGEKLHFIRKLGQVSADGSRRSWIR